MADDARIICFVVKRYAPDVMVWQMMRGLYVLWLKGMLQVMVWQMMRGLYVLW